MSRIERMIRYLTVDGKSVTAIAGWDAADTEACVDEYVVAGIRSHDGVLGA